MDEDYFQKVIQDDGSISAAENSSLEDTPVSNA